MIILLAVLLLVVLATSLVLRHPSFGRRTSARRKARIEASPNWRDGMFRNEIATPQFTANKSTPRVFWEFLTASRKDRIPKEAVEAVKTDLKALPADKDWLVWLGHSSYLFCLQGKRYLVDPVLKMEFPVTLMMKPFRGTCIYSPADLPEIDVLIITHEHWDHLDYATLRNLKHKAKHTVCPLGVAEYLEHWGFDKQRITEMDWHEKAVNLGDTESTITCLPTRHFSNRLFKRNQTLWAAFLVESSTRKVYVGGDGGYDHRFKQVYEQYGQVDLALMENGQYNQDWAYIHLMPKDLENAILDLHAKQVFTVHHGKFALAKHSWTEPGNVARDIATRHHINLLDKPIGTVVRF